MEASCISYTLLMWTFILFLEICSKETTDEVGTVTVLDPVYRRRNVTLRFTPNINRFGFELSSCKWEAMLNGKSSFSAISNSHLRYIKDGSLYLKLINVDRTWEGALVQVRYMTKVSRNVKLHFPEFQNDCGDLFLVTFPEYQGDSGQIAYYPSNKVFDNPELYYRQLMRRTSETLEMDKAMYTELRDAHDLKYLFIIHNITHDGEYFLKCLNGTRSHTTYGVDMYPGSPEIGASCNLNGCVDCLCVNPGDVINCTSYSTNMTMWIDSVNVNIQRDNTKYPYLYSSNGVRIDGHYHMVPVSCVAYIQNTRFSFNRTSLLYIFVPPKRPFLYVPKLKEDSIAKIGCFSYNGRPPPKLEMRLEGERLLDAEQENIYSEDSHLYTSVLSTDAANRTWNGKTVTCTSMILDTRNVYNLGHAENATVTFIYPPIALYMIKPQMPRHLAHWFELTIECIAVDTNSQCGLTWDSNITNMTGTSNTTNHYITSSVNTNVSTNRNITSTVNINVSKPMQGGFIRCKVLCNDFKTILEKNFVLSFEDSTQPSMIPLLDKPWIHIWIGIGAVLLLCCFIGVTVIVTKRCSKTNISSKHKKSDADLQNHHVAGDINSALFANVAYTDASPAEEVTDQIYNEIDENCSYNERSQSASWKQNKMEFLPMLSKPNNLSIGPSASCGSIKGKYDADNEEVRYMEVYPDSTYSSCSSGTQTPIREAVAYEDLLWPRSDTDVTYEGMASEGSISNSRIKLKK
ncbi:uncharacterized protein LOC127874041 isoform X1 [Dreissena polymorpha]|uniref:uncharacterized protein LOC127874041 isoform X1 n=1 Tax=Dreissena polymorpha TaxID=45954 RepID=UPI002264B0B0|nr:uncharacterized protein LOC127874041 isoform X1 [Dreissena polymorpha]